MNNNQWPWHNVRKKNVCLARLSHPGTVLPWELFSCCQFLLRVGASISLWWGTLSNAVLKSIQMLSTRPSFSCTAIILIIKFERDFSCTVSFFKSQTASVSSANFSTCSAETFLVTFSIILHTTFVTRTGLSLSISFINKRKNVILLPYIWSLACFMDSINMLRGQDVSRLLSLGLAV